MGFYIRKAIRAGLSGSIYPNPVLAYQQASKDFVSGQGLGEIMSTWEEAACIIEKLYPQVRPREISNRLGRYYSKVTPRLNMSH